jgi:hypothetical protein
MSTIAVNTITPATGSSVSIPSFVPAAAFSFRNKIINGAMGIDQRNAGAAQTITAAAARAYTIDRWYTYCTGANVTGQQIAGTAPNQFNYQFTGAASVTKIGFAQRIENSNSQDLAGTTATLAVDLANSLLTTVTWTAWYANTNNTFGSLVSPTRTQIATGTFTVTSTLTRYSTNISIPAAATTGIEVEFSVAAQTSGTWTIGEAQLEAGSVATPFEHRPIGAELALCQRYYYKIFPGATNSNLGCNGFTNGTTDAILNGQFPVTMRIAPTALEQSGTASDYRITAASGAANCSSVPVFGSNTNMFAWGVNFTVSSGLTSGQGASGRTGSTTGASGYLAWSAEL